MSDKISGTKNISATVNFGFWTYVFTKVPFRLGGQPILQILSIRQQGLRQKAIFKELQQIKAFRNRITHHEPICFDAIGHKSIVYAQTNYVLILKYIAFLGYDKDDLLFGLDAIPDSMTNKNIQL